MSLRVREEIKSCFRKKGRLVPIDTVADDILKIFEKRIDEFMEEEKQNLKKHGLVQTQLHEITGKLVAWNRVKEMLSSVSV
jgi:hypothetical protein